MEEIPEIQKVEIEDLALEMVKMTEELLHEVKEKKADSGLVEIMAPLQKGLEEVKVIDLQVVHLKLQKVEDPEEVNGIC
ncbi:MAG: hypothetical protein KDC50_08325, partial [Flavobacterium sp.]|nr:hypothetical protein [Flavobacterium sp.]